MNTPLSSQKTTSSTVYFVPASVHYKEDRDIFALSTILTHIRYPFLSQLKPRDIVAVKPCDYFPKQIYRYTKAFAQLLIDQGHSGFIGTTSQRHLDITYQAVDHAYHSLLADTSDSPIPVLPLDGIYGEHKITPKTYRTSKHEVHIAGELPNLDAVVSVCCFAQSTEVEELGSIVNLGQGLASKRGKIIQRTTNSPQVHVTNCRACRRCLRECPSHAISIADKHAVIDPNKCTKCGKCVEIAHYGGITYDWNASLEHYSSAVARHAKAVQSMLPNRIVCVNIVLSETEQEQTFAGAMISLDPVAVDLATLEFCQNHSLVNETSLTRLQSLIHAAQAEGVGNLEYHIETVAY